MSKVEKTTIEDNVYRISITLGKEELETELNKKLKEYRKNAQWKGFRKGTAPLSFVKKMVGNQLFSDIIEKMTSEALFGKIKEDNLNYIGTPIPADNVPVPELSMNNIEDLKFAFDVAVVPNFDVKEPTDVEFESYKISNLDELAKKELEQAQLSLGTDEPTEANFDESASLQVKLSELDGDTIKEGGVTNETTLKVAEIDNEKLKTKLAKAKVGDSFDFAPFEDLSVKDEKYVSSTLLGLDEAYEGELPQKFNAEIISATKRVPAEKNQEFWDRLFGEGLVDSEEKAIGRLVEYFESRYENDNAQILMKNWKDKLMEENAVALPSDYIKKIISETNQGIEEEALDKDLPLIEEDLVWSTIRQQLLTKYKIPEATEHDIEHAIAHSIGSQYGIDPHHEIIMNMAKDTMKQDKNKVESTFYALMEGRLFDRIKPTLKTQEVFLTDKDFEDKVKETFEA